jgi:hypothetical protein
LNQLDLFGPIRSQVRIKQKTVKHTPIDKLMDAFIVCWPALMGWWQSLPA